MYERQPILRAFLESGYVGKMLNMVICEKKKTGVALIKLDSIPQPFNIYWNQSKKQWQDVKPVDIIDTHYNTAV